MDELPDVDVEAVERFFADAIEAGAVAPNALMEDLVQGVAGFS
jgi:hypothetical protein